MSSQSSALLDRVKAFLPVIAKANEELKKQVEEGNVVIIDKDLKAADDEEREELDDDESSDSSFISDSEHISKEDSSSKGVQVELIVGDFQSSPFESIFSAISSSDENVNDDTSNNESAP